MRILLYSSTWIIFFTVLFGLWTPPAEAHPLGNFTINQYSGLQVSREVVGVDYVLDMAEIPAFQAINRMDVNHNRKPDPAEIIGYPEAKCKEVVSNLNLNIDQQTLPLSVKRSTVEFPPGVGGLATLRLTCALEGKTSGVGTHQIIEFENKLYPERLGWQEITVAAKDVSIQGDFKTESITKRLTDYPTDLLSSPLNQRQLSLDVNSPQTLSPQKKFSPKSSGVWDTARLDRANNAFTSLITQEKLTVSTVLIALLTAFIWGGFHALSPGHGKTIVGSYLVGSRCTIKHALFLGLTVTITHTAGIFALGLVMLSTSQFLLTEQLYPWLSLLSGLLVMGIGLNILIRRLKGSQIFQNWSLMKRMGKHDLAFSAQPMALVHSHQSIADIADSTHSHGHHHEHNHHSHGHHHAEHGHSHKPHSHLPPLGADETPITWSSLLALGISGGLLPCPSALVVLLSAIALGRTGFGLLLVSAFSLGLAGVLTGIGLLLIYAKRRFEQMPIQLPGSTLFPSISALCITLLGIGIAVNAVPLSIF
jgi:nickel/cobalt transporter (NicO) family protein